MKNLQYHKEEIEDLGYTVIPDFFDQSEIGHIVQIISNINPSGEKFRKSKDIFAIRQFLSEVPQVQPIVFNPRLNELIIELFDDKYFVVKSIYFDKPESSNWYVGYHQDLTISVDKKRKLDNFTSWTVKQDQFAVQPPIEILENIFTIRIHLDDTNEENGALKVIDKSHKKGIYRPENINWKTEIETFCNVNSGGIMIMKPLLLHGSNRTVNNRKRRVIHIEFSNRELPHDLKWSERRN
ncbi:phytanoyl-CoA dioxygenase family protein [Flavobacterium sp.]|uniref:phytanoyl-CoA dioxygenase family protein n=1 Tax=Flavobacterium sp. TaxID=239 RepID=UPI0011FB7D7E|nr:phytanoyl-CoA dioxygenase family protein [Flavobacterium sp.]RZJ70419.1 MAG: phytanoyl-CoA dioxygenase [Flavobacterium sp.]